MKRVFGLVGYACNGKSTIIKKIADNKDYKFIDLPQIYKNEAAKNGYDGVTEWYTGVGLKKYSKDSKKAVLDYIDKVLPRGENLIIDDIFDIDVYNKLIKIFPQMKLIAFHSKYNDRLNRLRERAGITDKEQLILGLNVRDNMKKYCGIEDIFPHCKYEITNKKDIETAKKLFSDEIKKNLIICIVGYSGSGKSTVIDFVSKSLHIPVFYYGKEVTRLMNDNGYSKSREYVEANGMDSYNALIEKEIPKLLKSFMKKNKFLIIDGINSVEVYDKLKKCNEVYSIYIKLSNEQRVSRLMKRENLKKKEAEQELRIKDGIKIESGLDIIVSKCNAIVDGSKSRDVVINETVKLIEKINN